jgi:hypothetical protein
MQEPFFCIRLLQLYLTAPKAHAPSRRGAAVGQGAGVAELLEAFDEVGKEHERMEAEKFNDDGTYKAGINKVRVVCG